MGEAWEWELEGGTKITAKIELPSRIESVWLGARLVSRSKAGGKGDRHLVPLPAPAPSSEPRPGEVYRAAPAPREGEVVFDHETATCTLRIDGAIIPSVRVPDAEALAPPSGLPRRILGMRIGRFATIAAVVASLLVACVAPSVVRAVRRSRARAAIANAPALDERSVSLMAPDGSVLAHFPRDFSASADREGAFLSLHRPEKRERIIIISMPRTDLDDPRDLDRIMTEQVGGFAENGGGKMSTTISREGTCRGVAGITSTATITKPDASDDIPLKMVSCSMLANGRAYFFAYLLPEFQADAEEAAMRRIVDATEILAVPARKVAPPIANRRPAGAANLR